jgi:glyoxylase-like metal-dependent hydrolase (beta-lactamase superfamily II)/rhodanese-related sulfurtransferase
MYFKQVLNEDCGCSSYIIASREAHQCAVVDPALDLEPYLAVLEGRGLELRYIIDTHLHADHVSGNRLLAAHTGAPIYLQAAAGVSFPYRPLRDGDVLELGELLLTVIETPGHRPESISLLVTNPPRSREPSMVLTGDCLFVGDVGRPDFGGPEAASDSYRSVGRLLELEDYVEVFPAHFEGSCGRGMCGRPSSTIGFERRFNVMVQLPSEDAFIRELTAVRMPKPLNMEAIVATNQGTADLSWAMLRHPLPSIEDLSVAEALPRLERADCWLLDVREDHEWQQMHIPGAHHIPQAQLATRLAEIPASAVPLVVCQSGVRSRRAAQFLRQARFPLVHNLLGGTGGWHNAGLPVETGTMIEPAVAVSEVVGPH